MRQFSFAIRGGAGKNNVRNVPWAARHCWRRVKKRQVCSCQLHLCRFVFAGSELYGCKAGFIAVRDAGVLIA